MLTTAPKNKQELIRTIQRIQIDAVTVMDIDSRDDIQSVKSELESTLRSSGNASVSIVILKGRNR